jgi:glucose/arabinose dehydrogenase
MRIRHGAALVLITLSGVLLASLAVGSARQEKEGTPKDKPVIPPPDPKAAQVPQGYQVEVAVDKLMYPSCLTFDEQGVMYVAECGYMPGDDSQPARILRIKGKGETEREVVTDKLSAPITDILWHNGKLHVSHKGKISVVEDGRVRDLVTGLPSQGDHSNNQLAVGPDGKIYVGQGSATNSGVVGEDNFAFGWPKEKPEVCETSGKDFRLRAQEFETGDPRTKDKSAKVKTSAYQPFGKTAPSGTVIKGTAKANCTILRMDPDGSNVEVYAWGFRNPYGVQWGPDGKLYVADAGSDERGSRPIANAPEKLFQVRHGAWYGWPDFEGGVPVTDPRYHSKKGPPPQFLMEDHPPVEKPLMTFELHSSVTQIAFSKSPKFGFEGQLFVASSGDQAPVTSADDVRAGYWVQRVDVNAAKGEFFFRTRPDALGPKGLEYVTTAGPKRLVGLRFSPQGDALYVVDIGPIHYVNGPDGPKPRAFPNTGVVWRIARTP